MPQDEQTPRDLYQILGIEKTDPSGAVYEAFVQKVAKRPPDRFPDEFKTLRMAYQTLIDPHAREEYDNLMACGPEIVELMNSAFDLMIRGRFRAAENLFRKIVDETGHASEAMMLLGMSQYEQGHFRKAIQTLTELVDRLPRVSLYRINLGNMLMQRYPLIEGDDAKAHVVKRAREQFQAAIDNDPRNPSAYISMAASYVTEKDYETAYEWTEKVIHERGHEDIEVLDPLIYGFIILSLINEEDRLQKQVLRIEDAIPASPEAREFTAGVLTEAAIGLVIDRKIEAVKLLILAAMRLSPDNKDLPRMLEDTDLVLDADREWPYFTEDKFILKPVKEMAEMLLNAFLLRSSPDRLEQAGVEFFKKIETRPTGEINQCLLRIKTEYPAIWALNRDFWQEVMNISRRHPLPGEPRSGWVRIFWTIFAILAVLRLLHYLFEKF